MWGGQSLFLIWFVGAREAIRILPPNYQVSVFRLQSYRYRGWSPVIQTLPAEVITIQKGVTPISLNIQKQPCTEKIKRAALHAQEKIQSQKGPVKP